LLKNGNFTIYFRQVKLECLAQSLISNGKRWTRHYDFLLIYYIFIFQLWEI